MTTPPTPPYIGRFAPSPSGPLHFGSLVGALVSFLEARHRGGQWLLRMEDVDPPREIPGAAEAILHTLVIHGLNWDGPVLYQSQRSAAYQATLTQLQAAGLVYPCRCTRKQIAALGGVYPGTCRQPTPAIGPDEPCALRLRVSELPASLSHLEGPIAYTDDFFGPQQQTLSDTVGDFIVRRKDGFYAYQLVVVVDDIFQQVSHVVRGSDLLSSTPQQIYLWQLLGATPPHYFHCPVALNPEGQKLSKQHGAPPLDDTTPIANLRRALQFLQQPLPPLNAAATNSVAALLEWAVANWQPQRLPPSLGAPAIN